MAQPKALARVYQKQRQLMVQHRSPGQKETNRNPVHELLGIEAGRRLVSRFAAAAVSA